MLTNLTIQNYTIAKSIQLDLAHGFNVLTGETGAGKSILIDCVALGLGARADTNTIRHGEDKCSITLSFDLSKNKAAREWLEQNDLASDDDCILRRIIARDGKSKFTINGTPCPLNLARELAPKILVIHGQHQHQHLLKLAEQRKTLDYFASNSIQLEQCAAAFEAWHTAQNELDALQAKAANKDDELDLLQYQIQELEQLKLHPGEYDELHAQHKQLHNAKKIIEDLNNVLNVVADDDASALNRLGEANTLTKQLSSYDEQLQPIAELLNQAQIHAEEALSELHDYQSRLDLSPETLAEVEQRISTAHDLARKHRVEPDQLPNVLEQLKAQQAQLEQLEQTLINLEKTVQTQTAAYDKLAEKLHKSRQKAAKNLQGLLTDQMQTLNMKGGQLEIQVKATDKRSKHGADEVVFLISTNPGQPLAPMANVVSGGELSRISLALQVITQADTPVTLIFDEVDTGIGGKVAETVGALLKQLGEKSQLICITHLPQVAANGHQHYLIAKSSDGKTTESTIQPLDTDRRIEELARMLGGDSITKELRKHAEAMLT